MSGYWAIRSVVIRTPEECTGYWLAQRILIGLAGFAAAIAMQFILPFLGSIYDNAKLSKAGGEAAFAALTPGAELTDVLNYAATVSFQTIGIIPMILIVVFAVIWAVERWHGLLGGRHGAQEVE